MYYLYVIECGDGSLYTGITTDVERRFSEHQAGTASKYTRSRGAVLIVYIQTHANRSEAQMAEAAFKKKTRTQKLKYIAAHSSVRYAR